MEMAAAFQENVDCPICFEIPEKEIYQCENGHTFCAKCEQHLSLCPQCKVGIGKPRIRCRALENMLDSMTFDCDYKAAGCTTKVSRSELTSHRGTCGFGENNPNICKTLGYSCEHNVNLKDLSKTVLHFRDDHDFHVCQTTNLEIYLEGFNEDIQESGMWTPIVIDAVTTEKRMFLFLCKFANQAQESLSLSCLEVAADRKEGSSMYQICFLIPSENLKTRPHLNWIAEPTSITFADIATNEPFLRTPITLLRKSYNHGGSLIVTVHLKKKFKNFEINPREVSKVLRIKRRPQLMGNLETVLEATITSFDNVTCDSCQLSPITVIRYKCMQCAHFDLCRNCIDCGDHNEHVFVVMKTVDQSEQFQQRWSRYLEDPYVWRPSLAKRVPGVTTCSQCSIREKAYVCLNCKQFKGYCQLCFDSSHHPESHLFAYTGNSQQHKNLVATLLETDFSIDMVISQFASTFLV